MLRITDDLKSLDGLVANAEPAEILETLRAYSDCLWKNRGKLSDWNGVSPTIAEIVWPKQEELELLHTVLFHSKHEAKIKGMYELITQQKPDNLHYATFYSQLSDLIYRAADIIYGQNQMVGNGKVVDFSDYIYNLINLRYVLVNGPKDFSAYQSYDGAVTRFIEELRKPQELKKEEALKKE